MFNDFDTGHRDITSSVRCASNTCKGEDGGE